MYMYGCIVKLQLIIQWYSYTCVLIGADDGGSNGASDAAIFSYVMIILLLSVIVLCMMVFVVKVKCKNR